MTVKHLYPNSTPELNLNFKSSRVVDPRIVCSRTGDPATYVDPVSGLIKTAPANVARVEEGGLLVEETRTNHAEYSVDFTNTQWYQYKVTPNLNAGTAPDGTNTAVKIVPTAENVNRSLLDTGVNATFSGSLTVSVYAKAAEYYVFKLTIDGASAGGAFGGSAVFDVSAGTVTQGTSGIGRIEALANGWYRCSVSHTNTAQSFAVWPGISMYDNSGNSWFNANGTDGCLFWGFQLEESSFATSYIPTSGSTVQRLRDRIDVGIDNWWNDTEGTIVLEADYSQTSNTMTLYTADLATGIKHRLRQEGASIRYTMRSTGGSTVFNFQQTASPEKTAFGYATDNLRFAYDGTLSSLDTSGTPPTGILYFRIGRDNNNSNPLLAGHIKRLSFYSTRASDTALQSLTQ